MGCVGGGGGSEEERRSGTQIAAKLPSAQISFCFVFSFLRHILDPSDSVLNNCGIYFVEYRLSVETLCVRAQGVNDRILSVYLSIHGHMGIMVWRVTSGSHKESSTGASASPRRFQWSPGRRPTQLCKTASTGTHKR